MDIDKQAKDNLRDFSSVLQKIQKRMEKMNIASSAIKLKELEMEMEKEGFWNNQDKAKALSQKKSRLEKKIEPWLSLQSDFSDNLEYLQMAIEENDSKMAASQTVILEKLENNFEKLELLGLLNEPEDAMNAYLNIHPGAGGTESMDWADMLYRMYTRWIESRGWKAEILDYLPGEQAGLKNLTLLVSGDNAYGFLKSENGIHRLVRISPFDSAKRRHTSFVSVHVSPELSGDIDIDIIESDLRIDTYRSSGAGGQHVNTTDSAVRITHIPTNIVVQCQNERSQMKNKSTAMKMLKGRLLELEKQKKQDEQEQKSGEKKEIGWGSQIRSYVFHPYNMVKDHRTAFETGNVEAVMNGELDPFIDSFLQNKKADDF